MELSDPALANIPGEEKLTVRAVAQRFSAIRYGVAEMGVAEFFASGASGPSRGAKAGSRGHRAQPIASVSAPPPDLAKCENEPEQLLEEFQHQLRQEANVDVDETSGEILRCSYNPCSYIIPSPSPPQTRAKGRQPDYGELGQASGGE